MNLNLPKVETVPTILAASYVRQSAARENTSEASPAAQRAANLAHFKTLPSGSVWCGHYEDIGRSAFTGDERPGFERLLNDCRAGRVNIVIVYYISRFSRMEPLDAIPIVTELLNLGVTLISVTEGEFRKGNLMDLIHLIMRLDASHQESKNKSIAVRSAAQKALELGGYIGGKAPYGRKLRQEIRTDSDGRPIAVQLLDPDPKEAIVVAEIVREIKHHNYVAPQKVTGRESPGSVGNVIANLNRNKVPTQGNNRKKKTKGSVWHESTLIRILRHPHLAGFLSEPIYKAQKKNPLKKRVIGHKIVRDENGRPISVWEPIISADEWFWIQNWLDKRSPRKWENRSASLLSAQEVLYCECSRPMGGGRASSARGSYSCSRKRGVHPDGEHEGGVSISMNSLDEYIARRIFAVIQTAEDDPESLEILQAAAGIYARFQESPEHSRERTEAAAEKADANRALETLYDMQASYMGNEIGRRRFAAEIQALESRIQGAERRIQEVSIDNSAEIPIGQWLNMKTPLADPIGPGSWWHEAELTERREFVTCFVRRISVRKALPHEKSRGKNARSEVAARTKIEWVNP